MSLRSGENARSQRSFASSTASTGVLPRLTTYLGPRTELAGLIPESAGRQVVE